MRNISKCWIILFISLIITVSKPVKGNEYILPSGYNYADLIPTLENNYDYKTIHEEGILYFKDNTNLADFLRLEKKGYYFIYDISGGQLLWSVKSTQPSITDTLGSDCPSNSVDTIAQTQRSIINYPNAFCNTDIIYSIKNGYSKEVFYLKSLPSIKDYIYLEYSGTIKFSKDLKICSNGQCYIPSGDLDNFETNGKIFFKNNSDDTIFYLNNPIIKDSNGNIINGTYVVRGSDAQLSFKLRIPTSFLQNAIFPIEIDPTITFTTTQSPAIDLAPLGEDKFVVLYCDSANAKKSFKVYNTSGTLITGQTIFDNVYGCGTTKWGQSMAVDSFDKDSFVIGWWEASTDYDANFIVYNANGSIETPLVGVDLNVNNGVAVDVSVMDKNTFCMCYVDHTDNDVTFTVYKRNGTQILAPLDIDTDVGTPYACAVSSLNSTSCVIAYIDAIDDDATVSVYDMGGTQILAPLDIDTDVGDPSQAIDVQAINDKQFVPFWFDTTDDDVTFAVVDIHGNLDLPPQDADTNSGHSYSVDVGKISDTEFIVGWYDYTNSDNEIAIYNISGDAILPTKNINPSSTAYNDVAVTGQHNTIPSLSLCTDKFIVAQMITSAISNFTTYNKDGTVWEGVCNIYNPCSCPSGTKWEVDLGNYCELITNCDLSGNNIRFYGDGNFTIDENITLTTGNMYVNSSNALLFLRLGAIWNIEI